MKKTFVASIFALLLCLSFTLPSLSVQASASSWETAYAGVIDGADILSDSEESALNDHLWSIYSTYNFEITIVTVNLNGEDLEVFADYYPVDESTDGVIFAHDPYERWFYPSARNYGSYVFSDDTYDRIDEVIIPYLDDGEYYNAYSVFLQQADIFLDMTYNDGVVYSTPFFTLENTLISLAVALVVGLLVAFAVTASMKSKMKTAVKSTHAQDYVRSGSFNLTHQNDIFLRESTTRTPKSSSSSSSSGGGGGSSSRSGRSSRY